MSFRFWLQARLGPGAAMNVSKSTTSLSRGPRSAIYTISPRGNRATAGLLVAYRDRRDVQRFQG